MAPVSTVSSVPRGHTHYMGLSGTALRTAIGLTAGLCFVAFGYGQGKCARGYDLFYGQWTGTDRGIRHLIGDLGGLMTLKAFQHEFHRMFTSGAVVGAVIATWNLGCFVGAMITVFVGDLLGRKRTITLGLVIMTIGKLVQVTSFSLGQYVAGRFLAGFGNG